MRRLLVALCAVSVAGCAHRPTVLYKTQEVTVPVLAPCVTSLPAQPDWYTHIVDENATELEMTVAILKELEQRRAYELQLESILLSCKNF